MARVRSRDTRPEWALRRALWAEGLRYRIRLKLPGTPDLAFPRVRVAVFVDGCFWHGCPKHYTAPVRHAVFWAEKLARNQARDTRVDAELATLGWVSLRFWEHEIAYDLVGVLTRIRTVIRNGVREVRRGVRRESARRLRQSAA